MRLDCGLTRREFLATASAVAAMGAVAHGREVSVRPSAVTTPHAEMAALRRAVVDSPVNVGLHRARVFTETFQATEDQPWIARKGLALRQYFETVPLYLREHDGLAGSISERPGAMPVMVELGIGENNIYTGERPDRKGYLKEEVPRDICEYWMNRNMWGRYRTEILGQKPYRNADDVPQSLSYKFVSNQGHLSPSYTELLRVGLGGLLRKVQERRQGETDAERLAFLTATEHTLAGVSRWGRTIWSVPRGGGETLRRHNACRGATRDVAHRRQGRCQSSGHIP